MKKKIVLLVAGILAAVLYAACGRAEDHGLQPESPVTVTIWHYYNGVQQIQLDEMVKEFNNTVGSQMGIIVEAKSKNSVGELAQSVLASVNHEPGADAAPNIFATYAETAYQIDKLGMLVDLGDYLTEAELAEYVDEYIEEGTLGGRGVLKIFPTAKSTEVLMLNTTDWAEFAAACGVTEADLTTWEGLVEVSEKYYNYTDALTPETKNDGKAFFGRDAVANYMIVGAKQLGHEFAYVAEDGTVTAGIDRETVKRLWENFYVPYVKGYFNAESRFRTDDAKIGSIIALIGSTTGAVYYPATVTVNDDYTYPIENVVLPVPNFAGCEPYLVQQGAGMSVLRSDETTEYACVVFLRWFTQEERNIRFSVNSGYLPVKKAANDFAVVSAGEGLSGIGTTMQSTLKTALEEINTYRLYTSPPYERSADVRDYLGDTVENTAKAARAAAQERILAGEDRESVWADYTGEQAFTDWYADFEHGFYETVGE